MNSKIEFTKDDVIYSKIGAALVSAQRVESIAGKLLEFLEVHGEDFGIMTEDFISNSEKSKKARKKTLGQIFNMLKLNPKLVIAEELDEYARLRNLLVHRFLQTHLNTKSDEQMVRVIKFCYAFGRFSNRLEKFFEGFLLFLGLRYVTKENDFIKDKKESLDYFMKSLDHKKLQSIYGESIDAFDV